ncbi:hypothetical protein HID58_072681 [Brassica napus]|uniref:F-box domain-containing protein n=3 Tax=Brassica TaxID=3705 RepID=A0A0D3CYP9_BRAOL|nr:putative F-box protein At4g11580 [Brassica napus]KAH0875319.1 hypothetical protein HID58_072681 [Brassica napus]CAF2063409.1 unnamed protein product [Brassica napus]
METPNSLEKISRWENMEKNILAKIFGMLNVVDIIKGTSRVCISWFLASHNKSLWKTIDLSNLKSIISKIPDKADPLSNDEEHQYELRNILAEITKFNSSVTTNLVFDNCYYIQEEELAIIAPTMPNVKKLSLPLYHNLNENSLMFTFSQWKNLQTLVITQPGLPIRNANFRAIGENCKNLTSLKLIRLLDNDLAYQIVSYFSNLESLSFRGAALYIDALLSLVTDHQNLGNLNLSHCLYIDCKGFANVYYNNYIKASGLETENIVQTATQKLDTFIVCSNHCETCNELRGRMRGRWDFHCNYCMLSNEQWKTDEIKELKF